MINLSNMLNYIRIFNVKYDLGGSKGVIIKSTTDETPVKTRVSHKYSSEMSDCYEVYSLNQIKISDLSLSELLIVFDSFMKLMKESGINE